MNLLEKATIITTATAYDNGKLHSVKGGTEADFDVVRGSAATRVNAEGLIEDISVLSGELVSNGDFSNGSTDWTLGTGWSVVGGVATRDNTAGNSYIGQSLNLVSGKTYEFNFIVNSITGTGTVYTTSTAETIATYTTIGNKKVYFTPNTTRLYVLGWYGIGGAELEIDNISIKEVIDATNIPRIDYTTGEGVVLLEPQSTNLITYSEDFSQWSKAGNMTVSLNNEISPDGANNATLLTANAANQFIYFSASAPANSTISLYIKRKTGTGAINLSNNGGSTYTALSVTDEWNRVQVTFAASTGQVVLKIDTSGDEILVYGAQLEALPYATSYIPTSGAIATRLADSLTGAGSTDLINSEEGVLYAEIAALSETANVSQYITISDGTYNNRASILFSNGSTNSIRTFLRAGGVSQIDVSNAVSDVTDFNKIAFSYKENNFKIYINGILVSTDTSGSIWSANTITKLSFNEINSVSGAFYGKTKAVAVFSEALTDEELTCLTTI